MAQIHPKKAVSFLMSWHFELPSSYPPKLKVTAIWARNMVRNQLVSLFSLGAALAGLAASYACIAQSAPGSDVALTQLDLARDYRLGAHITLHIASRPVGEVLYTIADLVHAEMRAVSWDREQRISLDVTDRPDNGLFVE